MCERVCICVRVSDSVRVCGICVYTRVCTGVCASVRPFVRVCMYHVCEYVGE